ncbi:hypothetical protein EBZ39_02785 [bacterium]|nr:hypothetical protein [bacterium]
MADERILFPEFRDEQADSRYPFADSATLIDSSGIIVLSRDLFIDASFFPVDAGARLYLSKISVAAGVVTIFVGDANTAGLISTTYSDISVPPTGVLTFADAYARPAGMLLAETIKLEELATLADGDYTFNRAATEFVSTVVAPAKTPGVRGLLAPTGELLYGDVWFVGDAGIVVRAESDQVIRFDVTGVPLFKRFVCEPLSSFPAKNYLKTINGCGPDKYGNFTITATGHAVSERTNNTKNDTVLRVYVQNNLLVFDAAGRSAS